MPFATTHFDTSPSPVGRWLVDNGSKELESLLRAIICHSAVPILIADSDCNYREVNACAGRLFGLPRDKIVGRKVDDFAEPSFKPQISEFWQALLDKGEQEGTFRLERPDGSLRDVAYVAKGNVLPVRHLLVLHEKTPSSQTGGFVDEDEDRIPAWVTDYALFLLDLDGQIVAWHAGAERIYQYTGNEAIGLNVSSLYTSEDILDARAQGELKRSAAASHFGSEGWQVKKDGSRFWANVVTLALQDESGELRGFARVVRDFSERHERDEALRRNPARIWPMAAESAIVGVVSGEFDLTPDVNEAFLALVGYTREDFLAGRIRWPDLTPPEYAALDELAYEEGLRFGGCTPFEKELIRSDGALVPVLVATAVLRLSPFRWVTFVQDLRERDRVESTYDRNIQKDDVNERFEAMVGNSAALRRVQRLIEVVAPTDATVLILGETGTGKELVAHAIHKMSSRRDLPFITLNCAAIPAGLLESELFGYEKGAFTGASSQKVGRFELANHGTLFLDEVGDIPLELQSKLLRAFQEKSIERLGGTRTIPINVRLVAATNRNLTRMVGDKLFRSDLYYRLKVFPITTPPLRDRTEDIPILAQHFMKKYASTMNRQIDEIPLETMRTLVNWPWPGNVRELENFIERSVILSRGPTLHAPLAELREEALPLAGNMTLDQVEREHIIRVLRASGGVVSTAASRLGLLRTTLHARMLKLGISRKDL